MREKKKETLERLWSDYLVDDCAVMDSDEEQALTQKVVTLHERASVLLNREQEAAVEQYVDALHDIEALFAKKAFFKGCEFAVSFLLEAGNFGK